MNVNVALSSVLAASIFLFSFGLPGSHNPLKQPLIAFTVNMTLDANDLNPGDTLCDASPDPGSQCTLRAAIMETNALSGAQEINLPAGTYILVGGAGEDNSLSGDLDIKDDLVIYGAGPSMTIIDGGGYDRVFHTHDNTSVVINDLTVRNGHADLGGGITNAFGDLTLNYTHVVSNTATNSGGGIYSYGGTGATKLDHSTIISNTAVFGGGIFSSDAKLTLVESTVSFNKYSGNGGKGGGVYLYGSEVYISRSTISNNLGDNSGGGIYTKAKLLTIVESTISGNSAAYGGGLINEWGELVMVNSTVSGNRASVSGGGIYIFNDTHPLKFYNTTIYANRAASDIISSGEGGGVFIGKGDVYIKNTVLGGNHRRLIPPLVDDDCKGILQSQDHNLIEDTTGCTINGTTNHNQTGVGPMLDGLVDNGGPSWTNMPLPSSPLIDKGDPSGCTDTGGGVLATDQRGFPRTVDGDGVGGAICDIGAVEFALNPTPTLTSLSPNSIPAGSADFVLVVTGWDFVNGAVVKWNGVNRPTTFVSSSQLSAQVSAVQVASTGSASVAVFNPTPGGGASNPLTFIITAQDGYSLYLPVTVRQ